MLDRNRLYSRNTRGRVSRGARNVSRPKLAGTSTTFDGIFMRPNPSSTGTIPATGTMSDCPDIWLAGTTPVASYQTALATTTSYATSSSDNVYVGYDNYIYVRGCNGASTTQSNTVQLFYAPNACIPWPSEWQDNIIYTDAGTDTYIANIDNLAAGAVGVADATFLWKDVPTPPSGSSHYCLIAWLNDAENSNPFPDIYTQLDMAELVQTNLGWGWRNTVEVSSSVPTWSYDMQLTIPENMTAATYYVYVTPTGFEGWSVAFNTSQTDAEGNAITLPKTTIGSGSPLYGTTCVLDPGFNATVTISMYNNGKSSATGASIPLACSYQTAASEVDEAIGRNLVDWKLTQQIRRNLGSSISPVVWTPLGMMVYTITSSPNTTVPRPRRSRKEK